MFDPSKMPEHKQNEWKVKQACAFIKSKVEQLLPTHKQGVIVVSVREIICGDPECAPIDTLVEFFIEDSSGFKGFAFPMGSSEVTEQDILMKMPPAEIIEKWINLEDPEWPYPEPPPNVQLRFKEGDNVEIRVGSEQDGLGGHWEKGVILKCWHRSRDWPLWAYVPYLIKLDNYRETYSISDLQTRVRSPCSSGFSSSSPSIPVQVEKIMPPNEDDTSRKRQRVETTENEKAHFGPNDKIVKENGDDISEAAEVENDEEFDEEDEENDDDDNELPHSPSWRFNIGDSVLCYLGGEDGWKAGVVSMVDELDPDEEEWCLIPYVVKLSDDETLLSVPYDNDFTIKAP